MNLWHRLIDPLCITIRRLQSSGGLGENHLSYRRDFERVKINHWRQVVGDCGLKIGILVRNIDCEERWFCGVDKSTLSLPFVWKEFVPEKLAAYRRSRV